MDVSYFTTVFFITFTFLLFLPSSKPISNYNTLLVYKACSTQTFNHQSYSSQTPLNSLFQQLIAQSSQYKFFKTTEAINEETFISGFFQCRHDITIQDCFTCVTTLLSNTLCSDSTSARVQLQGCYVQYKTEQQQQQQQFQETTIPESKNNNIFHKDCGVPFVELKELMDEAFMRLENGIINSDGFCTMNYKRVKLMAQCEGDLNRCECSECVGDAVEVAKEECDSSVSAQIYFDKCFISYEYMPKSNGDAGYSVPGARNNNTQKLIAIIAGGAAALFLGLIFVSLLNSRLKKNDYE